MQVQEYMTPNPVKIGEEENLLALIKKFDVERFRHLPVVDKEGRVIGMLSDRDLRSAQLALTLLKIDVAEEVKRVLVKDIMQTPVHSISPDASLKEAADLIIKHRIGALPVVDKEGKLIGILSYVDILRAFKERF